MAMYKYNGVRLQGVPSWDVSVYANAIIYYVANESGVEEAHFGYSDQPFYLGTTQNLVTNTEGATIYASIYDAETKTWGEIYLFYDAAFALEPSKVLWCNVDVLDDTGAVFLAGSEPVKLFPRRDWTNRLLAGLCSRPLPMSKREPVAWLYNGVRLPGLPEWDKSKYPYAVIDGGMYPMLKRATLYLFSSLEYTTIESSGDKGIVLTETNYIRYSGSATGTDWEELAPTTGVLNIKNIKWTNTDIIDADGSVYLSASAPIPVYE